MVRLCIYDNKISKHSNVQNPTKQGDRRNDVPQIFTQHKIRTSIQIMRPEIGTGIFM